MVHYTFYKVTEGVAENVSKDKFILSFLNTSHQIDSSRIKPNWDVDTDGIKVDASLILIFRRRGWLSDIGLNLQVTSI